MGGDRRKVNSFTSYLIYAIIDLQLIYSWYKSTRREDNMRNVAKAIALVGLGGALMYLALCVVYDLVDRYETGAMANDRGI